MAMHSEQTAFDRRVLSVASKPNVGRQEAEWGWSTHHHNLRANQKVTSCPIREWALSSSVSSTSVLSQEHHHTHSLMGGNTSPIWENVGYTVLNERAPEMRKKSTKVVTLRRNDRSPSASRRDFQYFCIESLSVPFLLLPLPLADDSCSYSPHA